MPPWEERGILAYVPIFAIGSMEAHAGQNIGFKIRRRLYLVVVLSDAGVDLARLVEPLPDLRVGFNMSKRFRDNRVLRILRVTGAVEF